MEDIDTQEPVRCTHEEVIGYEHDDRLLVTCRSCGVTMPIHEWIQYRKIYEFREARAEGDHG